MAGQPAYSIHGLIIANLNLIRILIIKNDANKIIMIGVRSLFFHHHFINQLSHFKSLKKFQFNTSMLLDQVDVQCSLAVMSYARFRTPHTFACSLIFFHPQGYLKIPYLIFDWMKTFWLKIAYCWTTDKNSSLHCHHR